MPATQRSLLVTRFDLGVRERAHAWRRLFARAHMARDVKQGLMLTASTLPLSLLLASLSGASASAGIFAAVVGSLLCALLGGTRAGLSGPGLITALAAAHVLSRHGPRGLGMVLFLVGLLQLLTGALGLARFIRLAPLSVLRGSVLGVALVLLLRQLPHMVGAQVAPHESVLVQLDAVGEQLARLDLGVLALGVGAGLLGLVGVIRPGFPGALVALLGGTVLAYALGWTVPSVYESHALPLLEQPLPPKGGLASLLGSVFELWAAATLGTALDTLALEKLASDMGEDERTDPDQELIANGLANAVLSFLHGLPATQLVARSAVALRLGVRSARPALVQALVLLVVALFAWPFLHLVPLAALTGVAVSVAWPLLTPRPLTLLGRVSRLELGIGVTCVLAMVFGGIVTGLLVGLGLAFGIAATRMARTRALVHPSTDARAPHQVSFSGPVTFLAALELEQLRTALDGLDPERGLVVDLRSVVALDGNGALSLVRVLDQWRGRGGKVALLGPSAVVRDKLVRADQTPRALPEGLTLNALEKTIAPNDRMLDGILDKPGLRLARPQLLAGVERFREAMRDHYDSLFAQLADGQHPHTLFITCADSRINPALLMGSHPGDLFIVRTIGALVARSGSHAMPQEGAAVEYGVGVLGVRTIVVCGHSKCGAISALKKGHVPEELTTLKTWARHAEQVAGEVASFADADEAARAVTVRQIDNLMSYPLVRSQYEKGELQIHAWFYDLGKVELFEWDATRNAFVVLGTDRVLSVPPLPMGAE